MEIKFEHKPVMLNEVLSGLEIKPEGTYIDCTLGGGGHTEKILERLNLNGKVIGLDKDTDAINFTKKRLEKYSNLITFHTDYKNVHEVVDYLELYNKIDGVLIDLGVSSYQIDTPDRGFSFRFDGPLDMRMNREQTLSAYNVVNEYSLEQLTKIIFEYGEEKFARQIAKAIVKAREIEPIKTTMQLSKIIEDALPAKIVFKKGGADKKTFQAIRIEVNNELDGLYETVQFLAKNLKKGGRMAVITFHSLEDRIVKKAFKDLSTDCICPPKTPICICNHRAQIKLISRKPITALQEELNNNPRASCAKLRIIERI